jgi:hypothetical protein
MHQSSWWLLGTSTLGDSRGWREELAAPQEEEMVVACPELLLPARHLPRAVAAIHDSVMLLPTTSPTRSCPVRSISFISFLAKKCIFFFPVKLNVCIRSRWKSDFSKSKFVVCHQLCNVSTATYTHLFFL